MIGKVSLGAAGLGWEVWCDGMEITQFTYFQQMTGIECKPVPVEIHRVKLCMFVQGKSNVFDLDWNNDGIKYKEVFFQAEKDRLQFGANTDILFKNFENTENECKSYLKKNSITGI